MGSSSTLELDHRIPGDNSGGFRPLCRACNNKRGANRFTDEEVLLWVRSKWRDVLPLRFLWWLNDTPGEGGRLHRSPACDAREQRFAAEGAS